MLQDISVLLFAVIAIALFFDFLNGFHDAANAIATIVVTRTLTPLQAVLMAGFANFVGYFTIGTAVAKTIGKGVVNIKMVPAELLLPLLFSALMGAVLWNIITWILGLPTSSSHALIGGLIGAAIACVGPEAVIMGTVTKGGVWQILLFIIVAPTLGMIAAALFTGLIYVIFQKAKPHGIKNIFKRLQLVSALFYSVSHGTNDAQKTMGVITMALVAGGVLTFEGNDFVVPHWVVLSCYAAISIGTMFGGWRIVRTMGTKITKIHALEGFCAESAAALVLLFTAHQGIPVSTTHVISGAIMGVGAAENASKVRWATARTIIWAWFLTIPATALCAAAAYPLVHLLSK
jgi:PiT family inorganic phosphate transporter